MKTRYIVIGIFIVLFSIILIGVINNSGLFTLNNKSNIKIGVVTPLTGDMSMYGLSSKAAIEFAADSIDYKINGQNIEFIFEDGQCNSESGTKSFNKLVNVDKVDFIIGSICSSETLAGKDIINENKILTISSCASAPNLRNASKYLFSLYPLDDLDGKYSAEYIYNKLNIKKVAILVCNSDWCKGEADIFKKTYLELGGNILLEEHNNQDDVDLRTQLTKIKNSNAEIIFAPQYSGVQRKLFLQSKELNIQIPLFIPGIIDAQVVKELANETNGVYGTRIESAKPNTFFTNELKRRTGMSAIDEDLCANRSYDSLMILKELIENTNSLNSDKIADNVKEINYNGISGNYTFDANNIVNTKFKTIMAKGGKLIEVE